MPRHLNNREFEILQPPGYVVVFNMAHHAIAPSRWTAVRTFRSASSCGWATHAAAGRATRWSWTSPTTTIRPWFDVVGSFHSDALRVSERFTPIDADTIDTAPVITDPKVYTRPWTLTLRFERIKDYGTELYEEACFEGNERTLNYADQARAVGLLPHSNAAAPN